MNTPEKNTYHMIRNRVKDDIQIFQIDIFSIQRPNSDCYNFLEILKMWPDNIAVQLFIGLT